MMPVLVLLRPSSVRAREQRTDTGVVPTSFLADTFGDLLAKANFFETDFGFFDFGGEDTATSFLLRSGV